MRASRLSQKIHKWLGLVVGIQLLLWAASGFYMVVVNIDIIHGDHLVKPSPQDPESLDLSTLSEHSLLEFARLHPNAESVTLKHHSGELIYLVSIGNENHRYFASSGQPLPLLDENQAALSARQYYRGTAKVLSSRLIQDNPPSELGARDLPIWRVDFNDVWSTSFYLSPQTGELLTQRHTLWRIFDFVWMLHIMDYDTRDNVNNALLRVTSSLALLLVLSGFWYLFYRLNVRQWWRGSST